MAAHMQITWSDDQPEGIIAHCAEHGVTPDEFEQVLVSHFEDRQPSRSNPEYWLIEGFTDAGRFLVIVFEYFAELELINPVTAFEPTKE